MQIIEQTVCLAIVACLLCGCMGFSQDSGPGVTMVKPPPPGVPPINATPIVAKPIIRPPAVPRVPDPGEVERMAKWENRLAAEMAADELRDELAARKAAAAHILAAGAETVDQREARLAMRTRLTEVLSAGIAAAPGDPAVASAKTGSIFYSRPEPAGILDEIERLSTEKARIDHLKQRETDTELCNRALEAAIAAEDADK